MDELEYTRLTTAFFNRLEAGIKAADLDYELSHGGDERFGAQARMASHLADSNVDLAS